MAGSEHLTLAEMEAGLEEIRRAPKDEGTLELIVRRPQVDDRETLTVGQLDPAVGLVGDSWLERIRAHSGEDTINTDTQINLMNARVIALLAQDKARWPLAGDQLYIDLDLSTENLPPGTRLSIGSALIEITAQPHNGCDKFAYRFGADAVRFVNSAVGKQLHLRGLNARVVQGGQVKTGDVVKKA